MRIKLLALLFLFYIRTTNAQTKFTSLDSLQNDTSGILNNKIVIGELHTVSGTYEAYQKIIQSLDFNKSYKLIIERGLSFSYLVNEYLSDNDSTIIDKIVFENEAEKNFYKSIYSLNKELTENNKILTIGIDLEYQHKYAQTLIALEYYLPKTHFRTSNQEITTIASDKSKPVQAKIQEMLSLIDTVKLDNQKYDVIVKNIAANFRETFKISGSSNLTWGRKREELLLANFKYRVTGIENFCFIIGVAHLPDNTLYPAFTKHLDELVARDFKYFYPIYFNHFQTSYLKKKYYCEHSRDPIKSNKILFNHFDNTKGSWLMTDKNVNYIVISN